MEVLFTEFMSRLKNVHQQMKNALEGLPQEAIDWIPGEKMNSLGGLVAHTVGVELLFFKQTIGGEKVVRDGAAEWATRGKNAAELGAMMEQSEAVLEGVLAGLSLSALAEEKPLWGDRKGTVAWVFLHTLDHGAEHLGHMAITRQMWDQGKK